MLFNGTSFTGYLPLGEDVPSGNYIVKVKVANSLRRTLPGFVTYQSGSFVTSAQLDLISADLDNNNIIDLSDYTVLVNCLQATQCINGNGADINDDGKVNEVTGIS